MELALQSAKASDRAKIRELFAAKDQEIDALKARAEAAEARAEKEKASCLELYRQREEALRERDEWKRKAETWSAEEIEMARIKASETMRLLDETEADLRAQLTALREAVKPLVEALEKLVATCDCDVYEACSCAYNAEQQGIAALAAYRAATEGKS